MAEFIISPYAISFNSIKNALQNYIQNKSDLESVWTDFYASGAGQTILELDAAVASFYAYHFIIGRRESYIGLAQNYNSIVGGALALGYNCSRGHNVHFRMSIVPNKTQTLSKWTVIGSYDEYDIVLLKDTILNKGIATDIDVVIGNSSAQTYTFSSDALQQITFTASNTTDDCRLILNETEVPFSNEIEDAVEDNYIMLTNPYGSVDVFYLQNGAYKYNASDNLYLQFIERNNISFGGLNKETIDLDIADQIDTYTLLEDREDVQNPENIRIAAPVKHETSNVVRARKDYMKFLLQNNNNLIDANDKDINPGLIALTYLKQPESESASSLLTEEEKEDFIKSMMKITPDGVAKAFIVDPIEIVRGIKIKLWQKKDENISANIEDDIEEILDSYRNKLAVTLDLDQIEHEVEQLPGVKVARVELGGAEYQLDTNYKIYDMITVEDIGDKAETWTLYCGAIRSKTDSTEPDWASAPNYGDQIIDGNYIWENSNKYAPVVRAEWKANGTYELFTDINMNYEIQPNCTKATESVWGAPTIKDGNVTWSKVKTYDDVAERKNSTKYTKDSYVTVKKNKNIAVYKATSVTHKSSDEAPLWDSVEEGELIVDNALIWKCLCSSWKANTDYNSTNVGYVKDGKLYIYQSSLGTSGETNPLDGSDTVEDNDIIWSLMNVYDLSVWEVSTEFDVNTYVKGNNRYFVCTANDYTATGIDTTFYESGWLNTVEDNNVNWELDSFELREEIKSASGKIWEGSKAYRKRDLIITNDDENCYIYEAAYVVNEVTTFDNIIYSVVNFAGQTGSSTPSWYYEKIEDGETVQIQNDNVIDNNILWTKTDNTSDVEWTADTVKLHGDIIKTDYGCFVFSSVVGKSGTEDPDWIGIENNIVKDNDITWVKLDEAKSISLKWNEYLNLKAETVIVG